MSVPPRAEPVIRNISDTARWAAAYRALETERPNALFRDPLARRLAGERGQQIFASLPPKDRNEWAWVIRTALFDRFVAEQVAAGVDMVVNLAAGLDARPYRMSLPAALQWIEVDLPDLLAYKQEILGNEKPVCALERVPLDLKDVEARRGLLAQLARRSRKTLVLTEGLVIYLTSEEVGSLARDLAAPEPFRYWALDIASPGLLRMLQRKIGTALDRASSPLKFAPEEGPEFFTRFGWRPVAVRSTLKEAARAGRLSLLLKLVAKLPESSGRQGKRPWSGICLLEKSSLLS